MTPALVAGAGVGAGLLLVRRGASRRPMPLEGVLRRLDRIGPAVAEVTDGSGATTRLPEPIERLVTGAPGAVRPCDLAVLGRSSARHALDKLASAVAMALIAAALGLVLVPLGYGTPVLVFVVTVAAAAVGFLVPDLAVRSQATARRHGFRQALSSYLDLVNVLLAGGAGIETSLEAAADAGDGQAFSALRDELVRSRTMRRSPWACFAELGGRIAVEELVELASSVQLAGEHGARIKGSLAAKAAALRAHQLAQVEADAQSATERMGVPTVLMFVGFVGLLGYPAVQMIASGW